MSEGTAKVTLTKMPIQQLPRSWNKTFRKLVGQISCMTQHLLDGFWDNCVKVDIGSHGEQHW